MIGAAIPCTLEGYRTKGSESRILSVIKKHDVAALEAESRFVAALQPFSSTGFRCQPCPRQLWDRRRARDAVRPIMTIKKRLFDCR